MKPIVVVGSINMDLVSVTERAPEPGETVLGTTFQTYSGGKGANQAVTVARLGYPSILLGKVGNDIFGSQLLEALGAAGVDTSHVERVSNSTGTASIVVDSRGESRIIVTPSANLHVSPEYLESKRQILSEAGMVLTQLEVPLPTVSHLACLCEDFAVPLMLDPAPAQELDPKIFPRITWLTPNQTEASFYSNGIVGADATVNNLLDRGVRNVILKQGAGGVVIANREGKSYPISAFCVDAVDTTAAGDAFNGAFATAQLRGLSVEDSARYAAAAAALTVTRKGAQSSLPTREEVGRFLEVRKVVSSCSSNTI
jgi:ribokinase